MSNVSMLNVWQQQQQQKMLGKCLALCVHRRSQQQPYIYVYHHYHSCGRVFRLQLSADRRLISYEETESEKKFFVSLNSRAKFFLCVFQFVLTTNDKVPNVKVALL